VVDHFYKTSVNHTHPIPIIQMDHQMISITHREISTVHLSVAVVFLEVASPVKKISMASEAFEAFVAVVAVAVDEDVDDSSILDQDNERNRTMKSL